MRAYTTDGPAVLHVGRLTARESKSRASNMVRSNRVESGDIYLVEQVLLRHEVFLEHVLVEVVGGTDAPLHTTAGHLCDGRYGRGVQEPTRGRVGETSYRS